MSIGWTKVIFKGLFVSIYGREMFETCYKMAALIQSGLDLCHRLSPHVSHYCSRKVLMPYVQASQGKVILAGLICIL